MSQQALEMGQACKIAVGLMTVFFFVAGIFASILALAHGSAILQIA